VSAVLATQGHDATKDWLEGLADNAKVYQGNGAVMSAVNDGEIAAGIIYHYYWYRDQAESGSNSGNTQVHYFGNKDPGAFLSVSGGGVLKSSKHASEAQQLLAYITGKTGQQTLADSDALEYPVGNGIAAAPALKPLSELDYPDIDLSTLNGPETIELMQDAGLL
jgi:iron(III) transport system substrate-binding protein